MEICGPKASMCCLIISAWAVIQLSIMGIFFFMHVCSFLEDVPLPKFLSKKEFYHLFETRSTQIAYNCWVAATLHLIMVVIYAWFFRKYTRRDSTIYRG